MDSYISIVILEIWISIFNKNETGASNYSWNFSYFLFTVYVYICFMIHKFKKANFVLNFYSNSATFIQILLLTCVSWTLYFSSVK